MPAINKDSAAIFYHPEAYTTSGPRLMGRNAAGESFLRGFVTYSQATQFWLQVQKMEHAQHFADTAARLGRTEPVQVVDNRSLGRLAEPGVVYHPGPGIGLHAWQRALAGGAGAHRAWSLCGITHTTSSAFAMDAIAELLSAPVQPWDALICTSAAVRDNVQRVLQAQLVYLEQRLGVTRCVLPQLPVIALGVHTHDFTFTAAQKAQARQTLGADDMTHVVLFMGRLSFHAKAHPLAMYQALERAAQGLPAGQRVLLVECGWHANAPVAAAFAASAALACPGVRVLTLDGRKAAHRQTAWAGADVFCSLSDNIQETFGIVPVEAMASGIPVVVSDWDGYRDTVRDGVDGFRVPTRMPRAGLGTDLAARHALELESYDMYCGYTSSLVAVDIDAAAQALSRLFADPALRRQMGDAGRQRARDAYDWGHIIGQYEALWAQLGELRRAPAKGAVPLAYPWPARMDPFHAFAGYPTHLLSPQTRFTLVDGDVSVALERINAYRQLAMVNFVSSVLPTGSEVQSVLTLAATGPRPAAELVAGVPPARQGALLRALVWLEKMGVLRALA